LAGNGTEPRRRVLLEDVAQRAGVSRSTASRALADDPRISLATRAAVKHAANDLRYIPNVGARSLRVRRTRTFGLLLPDLGDPVHGQVASAFEQTAGEDGFEVLFVSGYGDPDRERLAMKTFAERGMDAVAIFSGTIPFAEARERLDPTHLVLAQPEDQAVRDHPDQPGTIHIDDPAGISAGVDHLVDQGYRRIAYVESGSPGARVSNRRRREACAAALERHGLGPLQRFQAPDNAWRDAGQLAEAVRQALPEALVCYDDKLALGLMDELRSLGVDCPDDVAIVGFDGIPFAALSNPRLTTVAAPSVEVGRLAAAMLVTALETETLPQGVVLPVELIVGESTSSLPVAASRVAASG
jgi:DNA-binding LacI/PurR family transcriptional regulator